MSQNCSIDDQTIQRRTLLAVATSAGIPLISGCNGSLNRSDEATVRSESEDSTSNEFEGIRTNLAGIYREINEFPLSENGKFRFDVQNFEKDFDHKRLLEETRTLQERIESIESESDIDQNTLGSIASVAEILIKERILTHQSIAAGLSYGRKLMQGEYADATEAIQHGNGYLNQLTSTRRDIENELSEISEESVSIDEFEPRSIQESQIVLFELVQWTILIYRSFEYASVGFKLFEGGGEKINDERIDEARQIFEEAGNHFKRANELQERAHGRGQRLGYVVPFVRKLRCVLPVYRDTCDRLVNSFTTWQSGDEDEARRIGREMIKEVDQRMARCEESGAI